MIAYYKKDGTRYNGNLNQQVLKWINQFESTGEVIKQDLLAGDFFVSTVCLYSNYGSKIANKPVHYETTVFRGDLEIASLDRYSTLCEALSGHRVMVYKLSKLTS